MDQDLAAKTCEPLVGSVSEARAGADDVPATSNRRLSSGHALIKEIRGSLRAVPDAILPVGCGARTM
jgi:hypothetical protein